MFCPNCGNNAGNENFCPNCGAQVNQIPAGQYGPQVPQTQYPAPKAAGKKIDIKEITGKIKGNPRLAAIIGGAALAVIILIIVLCAVCGGKKYFKAKDYKESEKRVPQIAEDALNLIDEDIEEKDGKHTDDIMTQAAVALDNGFDKSDIKTMMKVLTKSDLWESVQEELEDYSDDYDDFEAEIDDTDEYEGEDDIADLISEEFVDNFDADTFATSIVSMTENSDNPITESEAKKIGKAMESYLKKLSEADIEELRYIDLEIYDEESYVDNFYVIVCKIDGDWICPLPIYFAEYGNSGDAESEKATLSNAAESMLEYIKSEYATGNIRISDGDTVEVYTSEGEILFAFDGMISNYSDELIEGCGISGTCNSDTHYRITAHNNEDGTISFDTEEIG